MYRTTNDLWEAMFDNLDPRSILRCAQVDQRFNRIITRSTSLQLSLYRHLLNVEQSPPSSSPFEGQKVSVLKQLRNLIHMEKSFTEFTPRHDILIIGSNGRFHAAYKGKVVAIFDRVLRAGDREEGKWKLMVEYTEQAESAKSTWERKEHIWDFRPDTPDLMIDLERDLVLVKGVSDNHQMVIKSISLAVHSSYCEAIHVSHMASSMLLGRLNTIVLVAKPRLHIYSLIDGQRKVTINLPPSVTQRYRAHYIWPNCILFSANTTERCDTVTIHEPTYKLIYPRELSDLPSYIISKIRELYPEDQPQPSMKGYISGFHRKNGILPIHAGNLKIFGWTKYAPSGEMRLWCHDLNQHLCRFLGPGAIGTTLGGMGERIDLVNTAVAGDHDKSTSLSDIATTRSEFTPESLGAVTRTAVYRLHRDVESRSTTFFDGKRLFFQNAKAKETISIMDWM
ncbi:hypothetical protein I302_107320 [Kwoniella bestiolae CBS 10118]|uniref:F-box domain-containing protein n=1 Tax=Kwoniella bestiolae CBS 10118 TaxID=1296100 RepID=A0A1B9FYW4_9TREE|nr:hypothetical protein I302_06945 [Kwoniella bestiolae CBS 10118]OCF23959.1 hypothetical protein I302_06945 [Kwoniella bestiolae CBS 10118]